MTGLLGWGDLTWTEPLPPQFTEIRPHQYQALIEIIEAFADGVEVVVVSAPTGSGKTLLGELARRVMGDRGLYICHGLALQDQFVRDFDAPVLKGRSNYPTVFDPTISADDCEGRGCYFCPSLDACPYNEAKDRAIHGNPAVLNTAYFLGEANGPGRVVDGRDCIVIDEADTMEAELMRWAEFRVSTGQARALGMSIPRKGVHWKTIVAFLEDYVARLRRHLETISVPKERRRVARKIGHVKTMFLQGEVADWVRVYDERTGGLILKPIMVNRIAEKFLWRHSERFILMSATIIGAEQMMEDLGFEGSWREVQVASTFPVEHRPVYPLPAGTMTRKGQERGEWDRAVRALELVLDKHPDERVLVHTVSYQLAKMCSDHLAGTEHDRRVTTYSGSAERARALARYRAMEGGVLIAPSMDRGVDLPGDLCRVQVVMKLPQPYLGDQQVNARLRDTETGELWYQLETIRTLVQMTGRGVRSADDWAETYVLDRQFVHKFDEWRKWLPEWWAEAVRMDIRPSDLLPGWRSL